MDIDSALQLIRVACDHQHEYNDHTRKALLTGIYELADSCVGALPNQDDRGDYGRARRELELLKDFSETGLQSGDLATAFVHVRDTILRVMPPDS
jgi:hypothetical protein